MSRPNGTRLMSLLFCIFMVLGPMTALPGASIVVNETADGDQMLNMTYNFGGGTSYDLEVSVQGDAHVLNASLRMTGLPYSLSDVFTHSTMSDFLPGERDNISFVAGNLLLSNLGSNWTAPEDWSGSTLTNITVADGMTTLKKRATTAWKFDTRVDTTGAAASSGLSDLDKVDMVVDANGTVHVVYLGPSLTAYYTSSSDNGNSWSSPKLFDNQFGHSYINIFLGPHDHIHIFLELGADGGSTTNYYRSTDNGETFTTKSDWSDVGLMALRVPSVFWDAHGTMHMVAQEIQGGVPPWEQDIWYFNSTDDGKTFSSGIRVDNDSDRYNERTHPQIGVDGDGTIHIIWLDWRDASNWNENALYYTRSPDHQAFSSDKNISSVPAGGAYLWAPQMVIDSNDKIHVVWSDNRSGDFDIYHLSSIDNGLTFTSENMVNDDQTGDKVSPDLFLAPDDDLLVTWQDHRNGNDPDIYYSISTDSGIAFAASERVDSSDVGDQTAPKIGTDPMDHPHVVWKDDRMTTDQIFYTHKHHPYAAQGSITGIADLGANPSLIGIDTEGTVPPGTNLDIRIRTSTDMVSWSGWEDVDKVDDNIDIPPERYVEYDMVLATMFNDLSPIIYNFTIDFDHYATEGILMSAPVEDGSLMTSATAFWNASELGGDVAIFLSNDNGTNWAPVPAKGDTVDFTVEGNMLRYKIILSGLGDDTPIFNDITVHYDMASYPSDVQVNVGGVDDPEHVHSGVLDGPVVVHFTEALASYLEEFGKVGEDLPVVIHIRSATQGKVQIDRIAITIDVPPVIHDMEPLGQAVTMDEGQTLVFGINASDPDGEDLTYIWYLDGTVIEGATQRNWSLVTDHDMAGTYEVKVEVSDGRFVVDHTWTVTVRNVNRSPIMVDTSPSLPMTDLPAPFDDVTFAVTAVDPDGDILQYSWKMNGTVIPGANGDNWTMVNDGQAPGDRSLEILVSDGILEIGHIWNFTILAPINHGPVVISRSPGSPTTLKVGDTLEFRVNASDEDGDILSYTWTLDGEPVTAMHAPDKSSSWYELKPSKKGGHVLKVVISDGEDSVSREWDVTVKKRSEPGTSGLEGALPIMVVIIIIIVVVLVLLLMKRKGGPAPVHAQAPETPENEVTADVEGATPTARASSYPPRPGT